MQAPTLVSLLALCAAAGVGGWLYTENQALQERVAALEAPVADASGEAAAPAASAGLRGSGTKRELAELRHLTDALVERMTTVERSAQQSAAQPSAAAVDAASLAAHPAFTEAVRTQVLDMATNDVDFRARLGTGGRTKIEKDAPFAVVADTLQLDASQEAQMSKDLQETQQELFTLLSDERTDGVVPLEIIGEAEAMKRGDPRRAELFMKLFTLKVPGGEQTYMQRAVQLQQGFRKKIDTYLRPRQLELLNAVEVDWFSIKFN